MKNGSLITCVVLLLLGLGAQAQWNTNGSAVYYNSGNIGVGTSSPSNKLEVNGGAIKIGPAYYSATQIGSLDFAMMSTNAWHTGSQWQFAGGKGGVVQIRDDEFFFQRHNGSNNFTQSMVIDASGNVGIGTTNSSGSLKIYEGDFTLKARSSSNRNIGDLVFEGYNGNQHGRMWTPGDGTTRSLFLSSNDLTPDITIEYGGNVGVGTTNPTEKLHVAGTAKADYFEGDGRNLTNLNTSQITGGVLSESRISNGNRMINSSGSPGQVWTSTGSNRGQWTTLSTPSGDNMGDHEADQNIDLGNYWLSGDGSSEGLQVSNTGRVNLSISSMESISLSADLDGAIKLGNAYLSTKTEPGLDFAMISTNAWYGSDNWHFAGGIGGVMQVRENEFYFQRHNGAGTFTQSMVIDGNGNVGIGTTSSSGSLKMYEGDFTLKARSSSNRNIGDLVFEGYSGNQHGRIWAPGDGTTRSLFLSSNDLTPDITIEYGGNVGVGTTNPTEKLHVAGTAKADYFEGDGRNLTNLNTSQITGGVLSESRISNGNRMINSSGSPGQVWTSTGSNRGQWTTLSTPSGDNMGDHEADQNIDLGNYWLSGDGSSEGLQVSNTGRVNLSISSMESISLSADIDGAIKLGNAYVSTKTEPGLDFAIMSTNAWYGNDQWNFSGTDGGAVMQVRGNEVHFHTHNGSVASFAQTMVIDASGNIGVGVPTPTKKLEVDGTAKATAFEGDGNLLTSLNGANINPDTEIPAVSIPDNEYMIDAAGVTGQVWTSDGDGRGHWTDMTVTGGGDNLGNHGATQNITMGTHWLSGDGDAEGLQVGNDGKLSIGVTGSSISLDADLDGAIKLGNAYFSTKTEPGLDFAMMSTNAWYGNDQWNFSGTDGGAVMQVRGNEVHFHTHNGNTASFAQTMVIDANGNVGLGVATPIEKLEVSGGIRIENTATANAGTIRWTGTDFEGYNGTAWQSFTSGTSPAASPWSNFGDNISFSTGNVGIGTTAPQHALDVTGTIRACEVEVNDLNGWCDYVFEEDYELPSLEAVEAYIKTNKHLMDIPSEAEVLAHGVSLNDMTKGLLKKVEELTLYMIEKDKENKALKTALEEGIKNTKP